MFALALAIQNLLWGVGQPFAGAIADRFGTMRVLCAGALALRRRPRPDGLFDHAAGCSTSRAGVLIGFGLSAARSIRGARRFGKLVPENWRSLAFGAGTAAGSFGQFLFSPLARRR